MTDPLSRRRFLTLSAASAAVAACAPLQTPSSSTRSSTRSSSRKAAPDGQVVLFQGDSITDAGRSRTNLKVNATAALGNGYPLLIAAALLESQPLAGWQFYNRGVSGNKVPDLDARWAVDALAIKPHVLSVLVGVNDFWHTKTNGYTGTTADYEMQLAALLARTRAALPTVRLVVLEPFVLRLGAVDASWFPFFDDRRAAAARVAAAASATWVPLQQPFDVAAKGTGPAYWAADGVHPTAAGHALIAEHWRHATRL